MIFARYFFPILALVSVFGCTAVNVQPIKKSGRNNACLCQGW